jgi:hypothetical protein
MAIQEVEISKAKVKSGITRKLNEGAIGQIIDTISISQYVNPEESTVRELTSNAVDSQNEKETAIAILSGKAKKEDFYIERKGAQYDDSNFNSDYYDLKFLDTVNNKVELNYRENVTDSPDMGYCDTFEIVDHGVGLGDRRLSGYFEIGYSSKRNNNQSLGAFGYGNKVSLSLRNEYYILETAHNGKLFKFQCYAKKIVPLITKFNLENNTINPNITFYEDTDNPLEVFYEETQVKNYSKIIVPTKKIHRDRIKRAINKQLLYFSEVNFTYFHSGGHKEDVQFKADILHNSKNIIISDNREFGKPHVIITKNEEKDGTGVCYGYIKFDELEMQDMHGNIGIKCPIRSVYEDEDGNEVVLQEGVSVNTSRESVIWDGPTKDFIKQKFNSAADEASVLVEAQLKEKDFLLWITKCTQVISGVDSRSVLGRLVKIIDTENIKPKYSQDTSIKFASPSTMFYGLKVTNIGKTYHTGEINRTPVTSWNLFTDKAIYIKTINSSKKVDLYLYDLENTTNFVTIHKIEKETLLNELKTSSAYAKRMKSANAGVNDTWAEDQIDKKLAHRDKILALIGASINIKDYDSQVVPEGYFDTKVDENDEEVYEVKVLSPSEKRKLNEQVVCYTFCENQWGRDDQKVFDSSKREPKVQDIQNYKGELYYAFKEDSYKIHLAAAILNQQLSGDFYSGDTRLVQIAKGNEKHFKTEHNHIDRFFATIDENNNKTMNSKLVKWNTARAINAEIHNFNFLESYKLFDTDIHDLYKKLKKYTYDNFTTIDTDKFGSMDNDGNSYIDLVEKNLDAVTELQLFVRENDGDAEAITSKLQTMLNVKDVDPTDRYIGIDLEIYDELQELKTYVDPLKSLFNAVSPLCIQEEIISDDLEISIREYISLKNR